MKGIKRLYKQFEQEAFNEFLTFLWLKLKRENVQTFLNKRFSWVRIHSSHAGFVLAEL